MLENNIEWTKLSDINSFDENPQQLVKVKRDDILIIKDDSGFHAINNRCPHLGLALDLGGCDLKEKTIHCKFHSSDFSYQTGEVKEWLNVKGFENCAEICRYSDCILIDRGDLSREFKIEDIPLIQKEMKNGLTG